MMRRYVVRPLLVLTVFIIVIVGVAFSSLAMPLYRTLLTYLVPTLHIQQLQGALLTGVHLEGIEWQDDTWHVRVDSASVVIDWQCLAQLEACIERLSVAGVTMTQRQPSAPSTAPWHYQPPHLPTIRTPFPLRLKQLQLTHVTLVQEGQSQHLSLLALEQLSFVDTHLLWRQLTLEHNAANLQLTGELYMERHYPLHMTLHAEGIAPAAPPIQLTLQASGALDALTVHADVTGMLLGQASVSTNVLDALLPLQGQLQWPAQTLTLPSLSPISLDQGTIAIDGNLEDIKLKGQSALTWEEYAPIALRFALTANANRALLHEVVVTSGWGGTAEVSGEWFLAEGGSGLLQLRLDDLPLSRFADRLPTSLSGTLAINTRHTLQGWELLAPALNLSGQHSEQPFDITGQLAYSQANRLLVSTLEARQQNNRLLATIKLLQDRYLDAELSAALPDLSLLHADVGGTAQIHGYVRGEWQQPSFDMHTSLDVQLPHVEQPLAGQIRLEGTASAHQLHLDMHTAPHRWRADLQGEWRDEAWSGRILQSDGQLAMTTWALQAPFAVRVEALSAPIIAVEPHCWLTDEEGQLCLQAFTSSPTHAEWQLKAVQLPVITWAKGYLPEGLSLRRAGRLNADIGQKVGTWQQPQIDFNLSLEPTAIAWEGETPIPLSLSEWGVRGSYDGQLQADMALVSPEFGRAHASATIDIAGQRLVQSEITLKDITLAPLAPWSSRIAALEGMMNGAVTAQGPLSAPQLLGALTLSDAVLDVEGMPIAITQWQQVLDFQGDTLNLEGSFHIGDGPGNVTGQLVWRSPWQLDLAVTGRDFLVELPQLSIAVSPAVQMLASNDSVHINGEVTVPWARVKIDRLPENAIEPSKDVHLRGEPPPQDPFAIVDARLNLLVDPQKTGEVKLDAFGLTANLHGQLQVATRPAMVGFGDLQLSNGRYQAYGQDLLIKTGELQFNGPLSQPFLLVEAIRDPVKTDDNVIAGIRISGPADQPNVSLFSEPAMDQSASLAYLLTGSGPGAKSESPNYNALLLGFGLSKTEAFTNQIGKTLGIRDLSIGTTAGSSGSNTRLAVSGRLNDRLSLQYNVDVGLGANDDTSQNIRRRQEPPDLALRYKLFPQLFIEAIQTSIQEQTDFAVDVYYEFMRRPPKQASPTQD